MHRSRITTRRIKSARNTRYSVHDLIADHVLAAERLRDDDTPVPVLARGNTDTGRAWVYVRDDSPFGGPDPPAALLPYSRNRSGDHPVEHLRSYAGILRADAFAGYNQNPHLTVPDQLRARRELRTQYPADFGGCILTKEIPVDEAVRDRDELERLAGCLLNETSPAPQSPPEVPNLAAGMPRRRNSASSAPTGSFGPFWLIEELRLA